MRVQFIDIQYPLLADLLRGHKMSALDTNLPDDARVLNVFPMEDRMVVRLLVESSTFDEVPELDIIPVFSLIATRHVDGLAAIADMVKPVRCDDCNAALGK